MISSASNRVIINPKTYLFVDGSNFRQYFNELTQKWFGKEVEFDFKKIKEFFKAEKAFYYDCIDDVKDDHENSKQFAQRVEAQEEKLNKIREVEGCHVYLGSLSGKGKKKRQKEVDVLLTVQMMEHALRGNMNKAVLLSGDKDFRPLVESLIRLGLFVEVVGDQNHISKDLIHSSDSHRKLTFKNYFAWTNKDDQEKRPFKVGSVVFNPLIHHQSPLMTQGIWNGLNVYIYEVRPKQEYYLYCESFNNTALTNKVPQTLVDFFELQYGKIDGIEI